MLVRLESSFIVIAIVVVFARCVADINEGFEGLGGACIDDVGAVDIVVGDSVGDSVGELETHPLTERETVPDVGIE